MPKVQRFIIRVTAASDYVLGKRLVFILKNIENVFRRNETKCMQFRSELSGSTIGTYEVLHTRVQPITQFP